MTPPTTEVANIVDLLDVTAATGDFSDDYDLDRLADLFVAAVADAARKLVPTVTVTRGGPVYAPVTDAAAARTILWRRLIDSIDLEPLLAAAAVGGPLTDEPS
jgi:hypothetical protein